MNLKTIAIVAAVATTAVVGAVYFTKKRSKAKPDTAPVLSIAVDEPVAPVAETLKETDAEVVGVQLHTAEGVPVGETNNVYSLLEESKKRQQQPKATPTTKHPVPEYFRKTVNRAKTEGAH